MRVVKGKVVGDTVVLDEVLPEGAGGDAEVRVRVEDGFMPDEETANELAQALKEADAGDFISEAEFWKRWT